MIVGPDGFVGPSPTRDYPLMGEPDLVARGFGRRLARKIIREAKGRAVVDGVSYIREPDLILAFVAHRWDALRPIREAAMAARQGAAA